MTAEVKAPSYDGRTILFHWATVVLVLLQWVGARTIDWFPRGVLRSDARSVHILSGTLLTVIIVARLLWRGTRGRRLHSVDQQPLRPIASIVHALLYGLLISTVGLGLLNAWVRGDSLFGLLNIPKLVLGPGVPRNLIQELHGLSANAILAVAALHASAALWHQYWRRDGLLQRMIPGLRGRRSFPNVGPDRA